MPPSRRVFFALWPQAEVAQRFEAAGRLAQRSLGGRALRRETLHLTLAFVGEVAVQRLPQLMELGAAQHQPPFTLHFDRLECPPQRDLLWAAAATPAALAALVTALRAGLSAAGRRPERRPFRAHVTLLRHARCAAAPGLAIDLTWPVADFVLAESLLQPDGARYRILARWPLAQT